MTKTMLLEQLIEKNHGYLLTALAEKNQISRTYVMKYVKAHSMEKVAQGIYIADDVWPDELFILQIRNPSVIFSGETALYLHGLIDREYTEVCITVPNGYNATRLKRDNVRVKYVPKEIHSMGVCDVPSISGNIVRAYDKERCICELIKDRKKYEIQNFQTAVKDYMSRKEKNLSRLLEYAEKLKIRDEVMKYVEVLV
ncbi:type IV toxin-antitoxin system AbiEi family antitoxin domain-containing protein [Frisingicoccus sp.]|uniref:type IV toxin-antitoxin system AbiEi family antitoxin domain-containing protein n=1 Tax=Frisingicoccus sp. TaxID=1918627 RepID=UPI003AB6721C